jgi:holin-like protein
MERVRKALRVTIQIAALAAFVVVARTLNEAAGLPLPGAITGMLILFLLLRLGAIRAEWLDAGTSFLFRSMLLFFVPAAVGAIQYPQLLGMGGLRVLAVVAASTVLVMVATGLAVEWAVVCRRSQP